MNLFGNAQGSSLELNVMMPIIGHDLIQSIELLAAGARAFSRHCVEGIEADSARCAASVERSLALVTGLVPAIGYDAAARIAETAHRTGRTLFEVALELTDLDQEQLRALLDPAGQAGKAAWGPE